MSTDPVIDSKAKAAAAAPKKTVHPLTVIFHALEDAVKSSTQRKRIVAALAELVDADIPANLQVPSSAPAPKGDVS